MIRQGLERRTELEKNFISHKIGWMRSGTRSFRTGIKPKELKSLA